ncbi:hypothetical protein IU436_30720 [Nocardia farcinica]|jgi:hypothetical protein|uniref:Uncharacterized protein n=1 Tax=Gordonia rubripertincta TaxID=36822 RepID=A0AAW4GBN2_GORRU|nr:MULTISPECIES: hypothetical protein [Mycobacteriales]MBF6422963.1 hypothetical protein [Nocardia farcinica]MBF6434683.1 hypothetical protein [Nocardia farcinica]MBF6505790.1 hypothetical protein [Nocardia farcinica]MBF6541195.1 hypothetical protein [Nocardia farcinica]MBM7280603.1 hypothetical protein [Gordonia rubripertincta]
MTAPATDDRASAQVPRRDEEEFRVWLTESCARQGVPLTITDPTIINQVAVLLKH